MAAALVMELYGMRPAAERFDAKTTVLIETVRRHIEEDGRIARHWGRKLRRALVPILTRTRGRVPRLFPPPLPGAGCSTR